MAGIATVCQNCRTWFEAADGKSRCPSCGARAGNAVDANRVSESRPVTWRKHETPDDRSRESPDPQRATTPRWASLLGALLLLSLGAGALYGGIEDGSLALIAAGGALILVVVWSLAASDTWRRFPTAPLPAALVTRLPGYVGRFLLAIAYIFYLLIAVIAQCGF